MVRIKYPRKNKHGYYPTGPGVPLFTEWKEYKDEGGVLSFGGYIEEIKRLNKEHTYEKRGKK